MSRYFAFVLLALSATSVLAAPADIPVVPDMGSVTDPVFGPRSNKVYSPTALHKRDLEYPTSTEDCRLSGDSTAASYTHNGVQYSQGCLSLLALSVPPEARKSCRTTGADARGYDEECLFKKAFDEDWKFDLEKAKEDERAWRAANPSRPSSDAWRTQFPTSVSDCIVVDVEAKIDLKREDALNGWTPYSVTSTGQTVSNDCALLLVIRAKIVVDLETCDAVKPKSLSGAAVPARNHGLHSLFGRSSAELATRRDLSIDAAVSVIVALRLGCLFEIVEEIIALLGIDAKLLSDLLDPVFFLLAAVLESLL